MSGNRNSAKNGAAARRLRPQGAPPIAAPSSRLVKRDKRKTQPPARTTAKPFAEFQGERLELVGRRGKGVGYRLHPIADASATAEAAHVDWISLTVIPPPESGLPWIEAELLRIFGLAVTKQRAAGLNGYKYSAELGRSGFLAWGGRFQRGTMHIVVNGTGCSHVPDWRALAAWGNGLDARIPRLDLAHDDHEGTICTIERTFEWHALNGFNSGGRSPRLKRAGDWDGGTDGRTLYIGTRGDKLLRVYEKGKQLGKPDSPWCRVELELRGKNRIIPWEAVELPGRYLAGAYPCLHFLSAVQSKIKTCQKAAAMSIEVMTKHASRLSGKAINVLMQVHEGDANAVVAKLRRDGIPKRLLPYETGIPRPVAPDENA